MDKKTLNRIAKLQIDAVHKHYVPHTFELYNEAIDGFMQAIDMTDNELAAQIDDGWDDDDAEEVLSCN